MKFLLALSWAVSSFAAEAIPDIDMHAFSREVQTLQKFLFSESEYQTQANAPVIESSLDKMNLHLKRLDKTFAEDPALRVSLQVLSSQIAEAGEGFRSGQKAYSRYMLQSGLQSCVACHTRTKSVDIALPEAELKNAKPLEKADYLFATRQFEKGRDVIASALTDPGAHLSASQQRKAMLSLAVYYARVKQDPANGGILFQDLAKAKTLPADLQRQAKAWSREFAGWAKEKQPVELHASPAEWLKAAQKMLRGRKTKAEVQELRASALLHRVLEDGAVKPAEKQSALFSLGQAYQHLDYPLFFHMGELYFQACIKEVPKTPVARECYEALSSAVRESGGNEAEVMKLRKQVY